MIRTTEWLDLVLMCVTSRDERPPPTPLPAPAPAPAPGTPSLPPSVLAVPMELMPKEESADGGSTAPTALALLSLLSNASYR